jgi:hypothetical protein
MDYSKRGPCCDRYDQLKSQMRTRIKVLHTLVGGNPRYWVQLYDIMKKRGFSAGLISLALESEDRTCPCNEAPNPALFREFYAQISANKNEMEDKQLPKVLDFLDKEATRFLKEKYNG